MNERKHKVAFFAGISAFIGVFENFIPLPVPFLRLGLSNIPVVFSFSLFNFFECLFIILFKVLFTHLFRGSLFSYAFLIGLSGNLLFFFICYPVYFLLKKYISYLSICVLGAFLHNIGQLLVASFFVPLNALMYIGIVLITAGIIFGFINGILCNIINNKIFIRYFE